MNQYNLLMEELERRYPDKALLLDDMCDKERIEYLAKLKLIIEIKTILGLNDEEQTETATK